MIFKDNIMKMRCENDELFIFDFIVSAHARKWFCVHMTYVGAIHELPLLDMFWILSNRALIQILSPRLHS